MSRLQDDLWYGYGGQTEERADLPAPGSLNRWPTVKLGVKFGDVQGTFYNPKVLRAPHSTAVKAAPSCYHHHGNSSSLKERSRPSLPTHFGNLHYLGHAGLKPCSCSKLLVHNAVESFVFFMFFLPCAGNSYHELVLPLLRCCRETLQKYWRERLW